MIKGLRRLVYRIYLTVPTVTTIYRYPGTLATCYCLTRFQENWANNGTTLIKANRIVTGLIHKCKDPAPGWYNLNPYQAESGGHLTKSELATRYADQDQHYFWQLRSGFALEWKAGSGSALNSKSKAFWSSK